MCYCEASYHLCFLRLGKLACFCFYLLLHYSTYTTCLSLTLFLSLSHPFRLTWRSSWNMFSKGTLRRYQGFWRKGLTRTSMTQSPEVRNINELLHGLIRHYSIIIISLELYSSKRETILQSRIVMPCNEYLWATLIRFVNVHHTHFRKFLCSCVYNLRNSSTKNANPVIICSPSSGYKPVYSAEHRRRYFEQCL